MDAGNRLLGDNRVKSVEPTEGGVIVVLTEGFRSVLTDAHSFDEDNWAKAYDHLINGVAPCNCAECMLTKSLPSIPRMAHKLARAGR